ncbi:kunitz-type serine protease inhibitor bitisilin-3 [Pempheris klunzingeri]|uniref:kunitz-type serine protease inhibitor bitisilin-3 n=1 Tax=Pempheris klunzingeri TaxID=3127111 RepID=UPI00397F2DF9
MKHLLFLGIAFAVFHISHSTADFCNLPYDEGQGSSFQFALHYDAEKDQCSPFLYKGQGGNANRFEDERECIRNCSIHFDSIYPLDATKACHFKKAVGICSGQFLNYYYDSVHDKCKRFFWSGCVGNGNRFADLNSCNATCAGIHDDGDEPEEQDSDTPIAIICGVLIAVILAAVLITVIVLTVKSGKKKKSSGKNRDPQSESHLQDKGIEMS